MANFERTLIFLGSNPWHSRASWTDLTSKDSWQYKFKHQNNLPCTIQERDCLHFCLQTFWKSDTCVSGGISLGKMIFPQKVSFVSDPPCTPSALTWKSISVANFGRSFYDQKWRFIRIDMMIWLVLKRTLKVAIFIAFHIFVLEKAVNHHPANTANIVNIANFIKAIFWNCIFCSMLLWPLINNVLKIHKNLCFELKNWESRQQTYLGNFVLFWPLPDITRQRVLVSTLGLDDHPTAVR